MKNIVRPAQRYTIRLAVLAGSSVLVLAASGCGNGVASAPAGDVARKALEAALKTWSDGGKPGLLSGMNPAVQVLDTPWSRGDRLGSYEIVREESGQAEKHFTVRLTLTQPKRVDEVQYYVLGSEPVMVFRDEDYLRNINMENGPSLKQRGRQTNRVR
jgi:hypothetical protein